VLPLLMLALLVLAKLSLLRLPSVVYPTGKLFINLLAYL
jgi:hypothetical protein